jgi:glycosyltransferase involved in cell wall biosynthesis
MLFERLPWLPFSLRRQSMRAADAAMGKAAGRRARRLGTGLVTYSYFAWDAIREYGGPAMLFQVHPHPSTIRRILGEELALHPECAPSLQQEWELALPEEDFHHLVDEPRLASRILVASSFTKQSLIENGTSPEVITVIPYGVDLQRFHPAPLRSAKLSGPLKLLFVGRINQRKGVSYLLEALRHFTPQQVHLTVCGRVVDDLKLFELFGEQVSIRPSVTNDQLVAAYQDADLFVFPSVAEGFGQVLLESLACGLPLLTTTSTAAPDLITDGVEGFILPPRRPDLLVARIAWAIEHRTELEAMHLLARKRAEVFTWARFRARCAAAVASYLDDERLRLTGPHA